METQVGCVTRSPGSRCWPAPRDSPVCLPHPHQPIGFWEVLRLHPDAAARSWPWMLPKDWSRRHCNLLARKCMSPEVRRTGRFIFFVVVLKHHPLYFTQDPNQALSLSQHSWKTYFYCGHVRFFSITNTKQDLTAERSNLKKLFPLFWGWGGEERQLT